MSPQIHNRVVGGLDKNDENLVREVLSSSWGYLGVVEEGRNKLQTRDQTAPPHSIRRLSSIWVVSYLPSVPQIRFCAYNPTSTTQALFSGQKNGCDMTIHHPKCLYISVVHLAACIARCSCNNPSLLGALIPLISCASRCDSCIGPLCCRWFLNTRPGAYLARR